MSKSKHLVGLILAATLMATLIPFSAMTYAQDQDGNFERIAEQAREKVDELGALIGDALEPSITWPDDFPDDIKTLYNDASAHLAAGEYKDAMKAYREVFKMLNIYAEAEGLVFERGVGEAAQGMLVAIDRAKERIARIRDVIASILADNPEADVSTVEDLLGEAEDLLDEAEGFIPTDIPAAASKIEEANEKISEAFAALKEVAGWLNSWRVESFLQGVKKSVQRTLELLERLGIDVENLLVKLGYIDEDGDGKILDDFLAEIELKLDEARVKAKARDMKGATAILREIRHMLTEIHQEMAKGKKGGPPGGV